MNFVRHPNTNLVFGAPIDWDDEKGHCDALPVVMAEDPDLGPVVKSYWKPSEADLKQLIEGGFICLTIVGQGMPPVALHTEPNPEGFNAEILKT